VDAADLYPVTGWTLSYKASCLAQGSLLGPAKRVFGQEHHTLSSISAADNLFSSSDALISTEDNGADMFRSTLPRYTWLPLREQPREDSRFTQRSMTGRSNIHWRLSPNPLCNPRRRPTHVVCQRWLRASKRREPFADCRLADSTYLPFIISQNMRTRGLVQQSRFSYVVTLEA
jgi:hypothetical protein